MHTRISITPAAPAPVVAALEGDDASRVKLAEQLGVAPVASVIIGKLAEPYRQIPRGTPCAMFHVAEGHVMHVSTDAIPEGSPLRPIVPPAPDVIDADAQLDEQLAAAHGQVDAQTAEELAMWKAEAEGLTEQLVTLKAAHSAALDERGKYDAARRLAESELTALKATHSETLKRLHLAEQDRDALKARVNVEREEHARTIAQLSEANTKLDRFDREEVAKAGTDADDDADDPLRGE